MFHQSIMRRFWLAAPLTLIVHAACAEPPDAAGAAAPCVPQFHPPGGPGGMGEPGPGRRGPGGPGGFGGPGEDGAGAFRGPHHGPMEWQGAFDAVPPYLHGLALTEEQQDKVFNILHEAAPALRTDAKAAFKARQALHGLEHAAQFDAVHAASLARAAADAESQLELLRIKTDRQIFTVLTPEQQSKLAEHDHEMETRRPQ